LPNIGKPNPIALLQRLCRQLDEQSIDPSDQPRWQVAVALFEPNPRPPVGPGRPQYALDPLLAEFCEDAADVEGRCMLVLTLFVGESLITATHGRRTRQSVTAAAVRHLLR
jgi:hypothetical protein